MIRYLAQSIYVIMGSPTIMGAWIMFVSMLYLLNKRAHRFRPRGELRLFVTSITLAVFIPAATAIIGWVVNWQLQGQIKDVVLILSAPLLVCLVFGLAVSLIQRFLGADAETALALSWPIVVLTYVIPFIFCLVLSIFQIGWLTGKEQLY